jgi:hypothetical protein
MDLHPALAPLAWLLGTWEGEGRGEYPTIEPFGYREELAVSHVGKPFLVVVQRSWALDDGQPLHAETGYWRATPAGVEAVIAHPFGATEVLVGAVDGDGLRLTSTAVTTTPTAKRIDATERELRLDGDVLRSRFAMAAVGEPLTHHLASDLRRV